MEETLNLINNKQKKLKNKENMTPKELAEYKLDIKMRLRNKINFKTQSRCSKTNNSFGKILNNKSNETTISNDTNNTNNNNMHIDINIMKDMISKISGSNSNPEIKHKLESLFSEESIGDLLRNDSMKDKMQELMKNNGLHDLFKQFAEQQKSVTNKKNLINTEKEKEDDELLDDYIKEDK